MTDYPINLPAGTTLKRIDIRIVRAVSFTQAKTSFKTQKFKYPGAAWAGEATIPPVGKIMGRKWQAFFNTLCQQYGSFMLGDPTAAVPMGTARDAVVDGTTAIRSNSINIKGMNPGDTLLEGDYFQIGERLYQINLGAGITADGDGKATLVFEPPLREEVSDETQIILAYPKGRFMLVGGDNGVSITPDPQYATTFAFIEDQ